MTAHPHVSPAPKSDPHPVSPSEKPPRPPLTCYVHMSITCPHVPTSRIPILCKLHGVRPRGSARLWCAFTTDSMAVGVASSLSQKPVVRPSRPSTARYPLFANGYPSHIHIMHHNLDDHSAPTTAASGKWPFCVHHRSTAAPLRTSSWT